MWHCTQREWRMTRVPPDGQNLFQRLQIGKKTCWNLAVTAPNCTSLFDPLRGSPPPSGSHLRTRDTSAHSVCNGHRCGGCTSFRMRHNRSRIVRVWRARYFRYCPSGATQSDMSRRICQRNQGSGGCNSHVSPRRTQPRRHLHRNCRSRHSTLHGEPPSPKAHSNGLQRRDARKSSFQWTSLFSFNCLFNLSRIQKFRAFETEFLALTVGGLQPGGGQRNSWATSSA